MVTPSSRITIASAVAAVAVAVIAVVLAPPHDDSTPSELFLITGEIRLGVDPAHAPFAFFDREGQLDGFDTQLAEALSQAIDLPIVLATVSFDGLFDALLTGRVDAIASVRTDQSLKGVAYTLPYADAGWVLYSKQPHRLDDWRALSGLRLAVEFASEGDSLARHWLRRVQPFDILRYETAADAFDALILGHSDAALVPALARPPADAPLNELTSTLVYSVPIGWAVRAGDQQMLTRIQAGLAALEANGTLDALRERWLGSLP